MALFTQDNQTLTVIVRGETVIAKSKSVSQASESKGDRPNATASGGGQSNDDNDSNATANRKYKYKLRRSAERVLTTGLSAVHMTIGYTASAVGMATGDSSMQNEVNRRIEMINDPLRMASSGAMTTFITGSAGLGFLAFGLTAGQTALKYMKREREYNLKVFKLENAITYNRNRAGIDLTTGRLR